MSVITHPATRSVYPVFLLHLQLISLNKKIKNRVSSEGVVMVKGLTCSIISKHLI